MIIISDGQIMHTQLYVLIKRHNDKFFTFQFHSVRKKQRSTWHVHLTQTKHTI